MNTATATTTTTAAPPPPPRLLHNAVPFPPAPFPDPDIQEAERDFPIVLPNGQVIAGYLRRRQQHQVAYERFEKVVNLGPKGKVLYGRVYCKAGPRRYQETSEFVVIKKLSKNYLRRRDSGSENPFTEMSVAQHFGDNRNIVAMREVLEDSRYYYCIMPYFGSDLMDCLQEQAQAPNDILLMRTLVNDLLHCQENSIIHRDFSPENVIVHATLHEECCPLIDFAMALQCMELEGQSQRVTPQDPPCGKLPYMSPEVAYVRDLDFGVDVWALGVTLFVIWTGQHLYQQPGDRCWKFFLRDGGLQDAHHDVDLVQDWQDLYMSLPDLHPEYEEVMRKLPAVQGLSFLQRDLLSKMLQMDPQQRIRADQILQHGYFQQHPHDDDDMN